MKKICICILAYNEQKYIAQTVCTIVEDCTNIDCDIKVYANGCTDATVEIVKRLTATIPNLTLRVVEEASKTNAWNIAFSENTHPILVFSDGDIVPERGAIDALCNLLTDEQSEIFLTGCSLWPKDKDLTMNKRCIGFLQIPLKQTFLAGGLYAIRRQDLALEFKKAGIQGIPVGIVAEDTFLEFLVPADKFSIVSHRVYYEPPTLKDYLKYLARLKWQQEQLTTMYNDIFHKKLCLKRKFFTRFSKKLIYPQDLKHLLLGGIACGLRIAVKMFFYKEVRKYYTAMGPVNKEGKKILSEASRSVSVK